jgi:hypothetical protein
MLHEHVIRHVNGKRQDVRTMMCFVMKSQYVVLMEYGANNRRAD